MNRVKNLRSLIFLSILSIPLTFRAMEQEPTKAQKQFTKIASEHNNILAAYNTAAAEIIYQLQDHAIAQTLINILYQRFIHPYQPMPFNASAQEQAKITKLNENALYNNIIPLIFNAQGAAHKREALKHFVQWIGVNNFKQFLNDKLTDEVADDNKKNVTILLDLINYIKKEPMAGSIELANYKFDTAILDYAAINNSPAMITLLLNHGFNVNSTSDGNTPLHSAVTEGSLEAVQTLLQKGAAVNATNEDGYTPLDLAHKEAQDAAEVGDEEKMEDIKQTINLLQNSGAQQSAKGIQELEEAEEEDYESEQSE